MKDLYYEIKDNGFIILDRNDSNYRVEQLDHSKPIDNTKTTKENAEMLLIEMKKEYNEIIYTSEQYDAVILELMKEEVL